MELSANEEVIIYFKTKGLNFKNKFKKMAQGNGSSYLAIAYLLTVIASLTLFHINEVITAHYHQTEIKMIGDVSKDVRPIKVKRKAATPEKKIDKKKPDTLVTKMTKQDSSSSKKNTFDDSKFFEDLIKAYDAKRTSEHIPESRADVVIRYYKKSKDNDRVYKLRDLGFYIHERPAESNFGDYASNAIFYGDSVKREDLMLIAYKLIDNGLTLRSITLSKFHDAWKAHSVEIGTDTTALNDPPYNLAMLRKKWEDM